MFWRGFLIGMGSMLAVLAWMRRAPASPQPALLDLHPQHPPTPAVVAQAEQLYAELERTYQWTAHHNEKPSIKS